MTQQSLAVDRYSNADRSENGKHRDHLQFSPFGEKSARATAARGSAVIVIGPFADLSTSYCHNGNAGQGSSHSEFVSGPKELNMCRSERPFCNNVVSAFEDSRHVQVRIRKQFTRLIKELF